MITTRNRVEDLRRTCEVLLRLAPAPLEILSTADGCTDGTVEFVRSALPGARLTVNEVGCGSVAARDRMMREARRDLVFALDDDSYPEQPDCLARVASVFEKRPRLAVAIFRSGRMSTRNPFRKPIWRRPVDAFVCQFGGGLEAVGVPAVARF